MAREHDWEEDMPVPTAGAPAPMRAYLALWAALLEASFTDALNYLKRADRLSDASYMDGQQAVRWMWRDSVRPASFLWACSLFDLEPDAVRRALATRAGIKPDAIKRALERPRAAAD